MRRVGWYAAVAAGYTYLLILFGSVVRITGSGLGCGDDWPRCNGAWLPPWDLTTWIEWGHRLLGAGALLPFGLVVVGVLRLRREDRAAAAALTRPTVWLVALLVVQALLGAVTVKLDLSPPVTALHFLTASLILGTLLVVAVRSFAGASEAGPGGRLAAAAVVVALLTIFWGALTANTGAFAACRGFPLCNGEWFPMGATPEQTRLIHIQWMHRMLAYGLAAMVGIGAWRVLRAGQAPAGVGAAPGSGSGLRIAATGAAVLVLVQIAVGAGLVLLPLPVSLRNLHVAVGAALFASLVLWLLLARRVRPASQADPPQGSASASPGESTSGGSEHPWRRYSVRLRC